MTDMPGPEQAAVQPPPGQAAPQWGAEWSPSTAPLAAGFPPPQAGLPQPGVGVAAPPPGMYFDLTSGLMLPNGTQLASVGRRIGAYFLAIPLTILTLGIGYVIWGLIMWGQGTSPSLSVLGMRCWRPETGRVATFGTMALREIIGRIVDNFLGITAIVSFFLFLTGKQRKPLHDYVAGTVVLYDPNRVLPR
jgi:uncharacterized RDD family membrane protein YckC